MHTPGIRYNLSRQIIRTYTVFLWTEKDMAVKLKIQSCAMENSRLSPVSISVINKVLIANVLIMKITMKFRWNYKNIYDLLEEV